MYSIKTKKPLKYDFDLLIIGSGAGGGVAAHLAAESGKKVGLIEIHALGGDAPLYGCIPTKALLKSAETLQTVQQAGQFGIKTTGTGFNYRQVQAFKEQAIDSTGVRQESNVFKHEHITLIRGKAHFLSPYVVSVGLRRYTARKFLIATGSSPAVPNIDDLDKTSYITYKQASHLAKLPKSIFIIGGGATAYEYAHIFSAFGTRVHIAEARDHLLPSEDTELSDSAEAALGAKGVRVHTKAKVVSVNGTDNRKVITFEQNGQQHRVAVEELMIATGKKPNVDLGLENTGLRHTDDGIHVNSHMQTSQKHIFAAGDVLGTNLSTHSAIKEGRIAVHNMYNRKKVAMDYHAIPRVIYGQPEIAIVGKTERQIKLTGLPYQTSIAPIGIIGKAMTTNFTPGFVKIIATHTGVLLGASIVAPLASEMSQELTFAIQHRHHACAIANTLHPFPTWTEAVAIAASRIKCI